MIKYTTTTSNPIVSALREAQYKKRQLSDNDYLGLIEHYKNQPNGSFLLNEAVRIRAQDFLDEGSKVIREHPTIEGKSRGEYQRDLAIERQRNIYEKIIQTPSIYVQGMLESSTTTYDKLGNILTTPSYGNQHTYFVLLCPKHGQVTTRQLYGGERTKVPLNTCCVNEKMQQEQSQRVALRRTNTSKVAKNPPRQQHGSTARQSGPKGIAFRRRVRETSYDLCPFTLLPVTDPNMDVHHLYNAGNFPSLQFEPINGIIIHSKIHGQFHMANYNWYDNLYLPTTPKDFILFSVQYIQRLKFIKNRIQDKDDPISLDISKIDKSISLITSLIREIRRRAPILKELKDTG